MGRSGVVQLTRIRLRSLQALTVTDNTGQASDAARLKHSCVFMVTRAVPVPTALICAVVPLTEIDSTEGEFDVGDPYVGEVSRVMEIV